MSLRSKSVDLKNASGNSQLTSSIIKREKVLLSETDLNYERGLMEGRCSTAGLEDGTTWQGGRAATGSQAQPQLTASREAETTVLQPQGTEFCHSHASSAPHAWKSNLPPFSVPRAIARHTQFAREG